MQNLLPCQAGNVLPPSWVFERKSKKNKWNLSRMETGLRAHTTVFPKHDVLLMRLSGLFSCSLPRINRLVNPSGTVADASDHHEERRQQFFSLKQTRKLCTPTFKFQSSTCTTCTYYPHLPDCRPVLVNAEVLARKVSFKASNPRCLGL